MSLAVVNDVRPAGLASVPTWGRMSGVVNDVRTVQEADSPAVRR